jgi:hypothetical protein
MELPSFIVIGMFLIFRVIDFEVRNALIHAVDIHTKENIKKNNYKFYPPIWNAYNVFNSKIENSKNCFYTSNNRNCNSETINP